MMENQVNVNSSRVQVLHLTVRLALERTALMVRGIYKPCILHFRERCAVVG